MKRPEGEFAKSSLSGDMCKGSKKQRYSGSSRIEIGAGDTYVPVLVIDWSWTNPRRTLTSSNCGRGQQFAEATGLC